MSTVVDPAMPPENEPAQALAPLALDSIQKLPFQELIRLNEEAGLRIRTDCTRRHLVLDQARQRLYAGGRVTGTGLLERSQDFWNLRWAAYDLRPGPDDVFVPYGLIKKLSLQPGVMVEAKLRLPRDREQGLVAEEILSIEGIPVAEWKPPVEFDKLTPLFPNRRVFLETPVDPRGRCPSGGFARADRHGPARSHRRSAPRR